MKKVYLFHFITAAILLGGCTKEKPEPVVNDSLNLNDDGSVTKTVMCNQCEAEYSVTCFNPYNEGNTFLPGGNDAPKWYLRKQPNLFWEVTNKDGENVQFWEYFTELQICFFCEKCENKMEFSTEDFKIGESSLPFR